MIQINYIKIVVYGESQLHIVLVLHNLKIKYLNIIAYAKTVRSTYYKILLNQHLLKKQRLE